MDGVVVAPHHEDRLGIDVRHGEIILFRPRRGHADAVAGDVKAAGIHAGEDRVPVGLFKAGFHADVFGQLFAQLHVKAHQGVAFVMIGPGSPVALCGDDDIALFLDAGQKVALLGGGRGQAEAQQQGQSQHGGKNARELFFHFDSSDRRLNLSVFRPSIPNYIPVRGVNAGQWYINKKPPFRQPVSPGKNTEVPPLFQANACFFNIFRL